jgi:hypothetical protein
MPPLKELLKRSVIEIAVRKRKCKRTGNVISAGELCLKVYDGQYKHKVYCKEVALQMIAHARKRLDEFENQLGT